MIRNASFFSFRAFISSRIQRGVTPLPAQVSFGLFLLRYLGATLQALGLRTGNAHRDKQTLAEYVRRCRTLIEATKLPLFVALVPAVGYALCKKATEKETVGAAVFRS